MLNKERQTEWRMFDISNELAARQDGRAAGDAPASYDRRYRLKIAANGPVAGVGPRRGSIIIRRITMMAQTSDWLSRRQPSWRLWIRASGSERQPAYAREPAGCDCAETWWDGSWPRGTFCETPALACDGYVILGD